jgi:hypothetical protein
MHSVHILFVRLRIRGGSSPRLGYYHWGFGRRRAAVNRLFCKVFLAGHHRAARLIFSFCASFRGLGNPHSGFATPHSKKIIQPTPAYWRFAGWRTANLRGNRARLGRTLDFLGAWGIGRGLDFLGAWGIGRGLDFLGA